MFNNILRLVENVAIFVVAFFISDFTLSKVVHNPTLNTNYNYILMIFIVLFIWIISLVFYKFKKENRSLFVPFWNCLLAGLVVAEQYKIFNLWFINNNFMTNYNNTNIKLLIYLFLASFLFVILLMVNIMITTNIHSLFSEKLIEKDDK